MFNHRSLIFPKTNHFFLFAIDSANDARPNIPAKIRVMLMTYHALQWRVQVDDLLGVQPRLLRTEKGLGSRQVVWVVAL